MTKHVFEIWGGTMCSYRGVFEKETDHFISYQRGNGEIRRSSRSGLVVVETNDPDASLVRFNEVSQKFASEEDAATRALADVRNRRHLAARASLAEEPKS